MGLQPDIHYDIKHTHTYTSIIWGVVLSVCTTCLIMTSVILLVCRYYRYVLIRSSVFFVLPQSYSWSCSFSLLVRLVLPFVTSYVHFVPLLHHVFYYLVPNLHILNYLHLFPSCISSFSTLHKLISVETLVKCISMYYIDLK